MSKTILQEIKQNLPFPSLEEQVAVNLMRTSRKIEEGWSAHIRRAEGLSISQYNVLRILRGARPGRLRISEIAERMINRDPDVTRLVDRLVKRGLVIRERDDADRRVVYVAISYDGIAVLDRLGASVGQHFRRVLAGLTPQRLRELDRLLDEARSATEGGMEDGGESASDAPGDAIP